MTDNSFAKSFSAISNDDALRTEYEASVAGLSLEEGAPLVAALLTKAGQTCTESDVLAGMKAMIEQDENSELSDEDLDSVAGGIFGFIKKAEDGINSAGNKYAWGYLNSASNTLGG